MIEYKIWDPQMIDLTNFRNTCCYCFKNYKDGLVICSCNLSLCREHQNLHINKFLCCPLLRFWNNENDRLCIETYKESCPLEIENLRKRISARINNNVPNIRNLKDCEHIHKANQIDMVVKREQVECGKCNLKNNLWICLECGNIGCGRKQNGIEGEAHALEHFKEYHLPRSNIKNTNEDSEIESSIGKVIDQYKVTSL